MSHRHFLNLVKNIDNHTTLLVQCHCESGVLLQVTITDTPAESKIITKRDEKKMTEGEGVTSQVILPHPYLLASRIDISK